MARKTVMRRLSKRLPMSTDLDDAFERDATMATTVTDAPALTVIEGSAEPRSKLDALEDEIEEAEAEEIVEPETGEAVEIEREGRADEAHGDQFDGAEEPAWQAAVEAVLAGAREAKTTQALNKVDDEWLKHRAAVSDEAMVARVDDMIAAARADLRSK